MAGQSLGRTPRLADQLATDLRLGLEHHALPARPAPLWTV
jgi:hypothetical protein